MSFMGERREVPQPTKIEWACHPAVGGGLGTILWVDVARTMHSALRDYAKLYELPEDREPADDAITIEIRDNEFVFVFDAPEKE